MIARKAYPYIRFSTTEQAEGNSLGRQLGECRRYAEKHGLELVEAHLDLGVSAFRSRNSRDGALARFLASVQSGAIVPTSILLVENLDRLSRDQPLTAFDQFQRIINSGISIVTTQDDQIYSLESIAADWSKLIIGLVGMARGHGESKTKSIRNSAAWADRRARIAQGQKLTGRCPGWLKLNKKTQTFELVPERVHVVKRIFAESQAGLGRKAIMRGLNQDSIAAFHGKQGWQESSVSAILRSEAVLGRFQPHRFVNGKRVPEGVPIVDYFPRIIQDDLFYRVQAAIEVRHRKGGGRRGREQANLFGGLGKCECCGSGMNIIRCGGRPSYLICSKGRRGLCENHQHYEYDGFEQHMLVCIMELDIGGLIDGHKGLADQLAGLEAEIATKQSRLDSLTEALDGDEIAPVMRKIKALDLEIKALQVRASELTRQSRTDIANSMEGRMTELKELLDRLYQSQRDELTTLRIRLAEQFRHILEVIRFGDEVTVTVKTPPGVGVEYVFRDGILAGASITRDGKTRLVSQVEVRRMWSRPSPQRLAEAA